MMQKDLSTQSYQLHILLKEPVKIQIGKMGVFEFPAGRYIYTGSAKRNIAARLSRHLSGVKKLRWHIDYLLSDPAVKIVGITLSGIPECELNQKTPGEILAPRFGAMDCRNGCGSHLKYLGSQARTKR